MPASRASRSTWTGQREIRSFGCYMTLPESYSILLPGPSRRGARGPPPAQRRLLFTSTIRPNASLLAASASTSLRVSSCILVARSSKSCHNDPARWTQAEGPEKSKRKEPRSCEFHTHRAGLRPRALLVTGATHLILQAALNGIELAALDSRRHMGVRISEEAT